MSDKKSKEKLIIEPSSIIIGIIIALLYAGLTVIVPFCVPSVKVQLTSIRLFPYIIFIVTTALAIAFAIIFRKQRYQIDFGIWPLVLGCFIYYFLIKYIGFYIATFLIILYSTYFWKYKKYIIVIATAILTPVVIYLFFTLGMNIHMPKGILF